MTVQEPRPDLTVAIIKPDAVRRGLIGHILDQAARAQLVPIDMRMETMSPELARTFYKEHLGAVYFQDLVDFMSSGPSVYVLLRGSHARITWRAILGATDPASADLNTLRRLYGTGGPANVGHGSDSSVAVEREMRLLGLHG